MKTPPPSAGRVDLREHFDLNTIPLTREFPVDRRRRLTHHEGVLAALRETVEDRMSAAIVGAAGTGKSVIVRSLIDALPEARYRVTYLHVTSLSKRDFCRHVATAIGAPPAGHTAALVDAIRMRATALTEESALRPVLILDEAHEMRPDVLGMLRLLTNFDVDSRLVLSVVLAGQPPLLTLLRRDELTAVRGRLAYLAQLRTLTREESRAYIEHRLTMAGATSPLFDAAGFDAAFEVAQGNLRALDTVALRALHEAAAEGATVCGADHVAQARARIAL